MKPALLTLLLLLSTLLPAQNLIPNGSFEEGGGCQEDRQRVSVPFPWDRVGTPDLFRMGCKVFGVPDTELGHQDTIHGKSYAGIRLDYGDEEMLMLRLDEKPIAGKRYRFSMLVSLAEVSQYSLHILSVAFHNTYYFKPDPLYSNITRLHSPDTLNMDTWIEVSAEFTAKGTERFLYLGNLLGPENYMPLSDTARPRQFDNCYIYIDNIRLEPLSPVVHSFTLSDILFDLNSATLKPTAHNYLDSLATMLLSCPTCPVSIDGHTDNTGSEAYNLKLSLQRAETVRNYLVSQGLTAALITISGKGFTEPIVPNDTPENRSKNRRVEIIQLRVEQ